MLIYLKQNTILSHFEDLLFGIQCTALTGSVVLTPNPWKHWKAFVVIKQQPARRADGSEDR